MLAFRNWIVWKEIIDINRPKPVKFPVNPATEQAASPTDPETWVSFSEAVFVYEKNLKTNRPYAGIGFQLQNSPYALIDLDDTHDDKIALEIQRKIFSEFNSYSEISPSGQGLHIIIKGTVPHGRRRRFVEIYSGARYMTMTGNVYHNKQIEERQELLTQLWEQMGGGTDPELHVIDNKPEIYTDEQILEQARNAVNGELFNTLFNGQWEGIYPSQSEADFALIDIIQFYTKARSQIVRLFHLSELGKRQKAQRAGYLNFMINKAFDKELPELNFEAIKINGDNFTVGLKGDGDAEPGKPTSPSVSPASDEGNAQDLTGGKVIFPPGLVGDIAQFLYDAAPRKIPIVALSGALGLMSGIVGRSYNVSGTGLNQYILMLAGSGSGKEAMSSGISKLISVIKPGMPSAGEFLGPGELVSKPGLIKWLEKHPSIVSLISEFGLKLKEMSSSNASAHMVGLQSLFLQLYTKSGKGNVLDPMAYSDSTKNTMSLLAPNFTILGESTPETFYSCLDENMITTGLLPRFLIMEYNGDVPYRSVDHFLAKPAFHLIDNLSKLMAISMGRQNNNEVQDVQFAPDAERMILDFGNYATDEVNKATIEITRRLWSRSELKAMKLAAVVSVGINPINPVIEKGIMDTAIRMVIADIQNLSSKFDNNEVGLVDKVAMNELLQIKELGSLIAEWITPGNLGCITYGMREEMRDAFVIPHGALQVKLYTNKQYRNDRNGPGSALKKALQHFLDSGDLAEVPSLQMKQRFGSKMKAYAVTNVARFKEFNTEIFRKRGRPPKVS